MTDKPTPTPSPEKSSEKTKPGEHGKDGLKPGDVGGLPANTNPGDMFIPKTGTQLTENRTQLSENRSQLSAIRAQDALGGKPNEVVQAPYGGTVRFDAQGRIAKETSTSGATTVIEYDGNSKDPSKVVFSDGLTFEKNGDHYVQKNGHEPYKLYVNQETGAIKWVNRNQEATQRFPSGAYEDIDSHDRVTTIYGPDKKVDTTLTYEKPQDKFPTKIAGDWIDGQYREFISARGGSEPVYYNKENPNADLTRHLVAVDPHDGSVYTVSLPERFNIESVEKLPGVKVHRANGEDKTLVDGDPGCELPEPIRGAIDVAKDVLEKVR
jgi:hypothetical protein